MFVKYGDVLCMASVYIIDDERFLNEDKFKSHAQLDENFHVREKWLLIFTGKAFGAVAVLLRFGNETHSRLALD